MKVFSPHTIQDFSNAFPRTPLFHYTSPSGIIGICESKEIWATKIQYLNDSRELLEAIDSGRAAIDRRRFLSREKRIKGELWNAVGSTQKLDVYVFSLSQREDQLSQWRAYSSDGGACVGFRPLALKRMLEWNSGFALRRCIYDQGARDRLISELVELAVRRYIDRMVKDPGTALTNAINHFSYVFPFIACAVKHASFAEEAEWRFIGFRMPHVDLGHRPGRDLVIPYSKIRLCQHFNDEDSQARRENLIPVHSARVGPARHPEEAEASLCSLFKKGGWGGSVRILRTQTPYRSRM